MKENIGRKRENLREDISPFLIFKKLMWWLIFGGVGSHLFSLLEKKKIINNE